MQEIQLPNELRPLTEIAYNYWWSWNQECFDLFRYINEAVWDESRNPLKVLRQTSATRFTDLEGDKDFIIQLEGIYSKFVQYLSTEDTWFKKNFGAFSHHTMAYFCAEYGVHESLPLYSGGLGILAGDHIKSASDLGLPMIFIGLFYKEGYFVQQINDQGQQVDFYATNSLLNLAVEKLLDDQQHEIILSCEFPDRTVGVRVFKAKVGRRELYLLDTDLPINSENDRAITNHLYGGDQEMRISQEIILGIVGVKLLEHLKIQPSLFHMNEGHSAFLQLERIRQMIHKKEAATFRDARIMASSNTLFTTHTPVPAGNEAFPLSLMHKYFFNYIKELNISWSDFLRLGLVDERSDSKYFSLTVMALNLSRFHNGVSQLHGRISQKLWKHIWREVPDIENPIGYVTNGVHLSTWASLDAKRLYQKVLGDNWEEDIFNSNKLASFHNLSTKDIRELKNNLKVKMIDLVRKRLTKQFSRYGESNEKIKEIGKYLSPNILTIGFARRFATYKRATLLFQDLDRLDKIVNHPKYPVQFIFAGKAHPADMDGQKLIEEIFHYSQLPEFKGKIIILENYDMHISSELVAGVDVWLNNPRRPMEASGTSGQKVPLNFGINFSVLDGWWREGNTQDNGWVIGDEKDYPSNEIQDIEDSKNLYQTLEEMIAPLYYETTEAPSPRWIEKAITSFTTCAATYSSHRMVKDYMANLYSHAIRYGELFKKSPETVKEYSSKWEHFELIWPSITYLKTAFSGQVYEVKSNYEATQKTPAHHINIPIDDLLPGRVFKTTETIVTTSIYLGDLLTDDIVCELVITDFSSNKLSTHELNCVAMKEGGIFKYQGIFKSVDGRPKRLRLRVYPKLSMQETKYELGFMIWY